MCIRKMNVSIIEIIERIHFLFTFWQEITADVNVSNVNVILFCFCQEIF